MEYTGVFSFPMVHNTISDTYFIPHAVLPSSVLQNLLQRCQERWYTGVRHWKLI